MTANIHQTPRRRTAPEIVSRGEPLIRDPQDDESNDERGERNRDPLDRASHDPSVRLFDSIESLSQ